jgi:hypothetical protein
LPDVPDVLEGEFHCWDIRVAKDCWHFIPGWLRDYHYVSLNVNPEERPLIEGFRFWFLGGPSDGSGDESFEVYYPKSPNAGSEIEILVRDGQHEPLFAVPWVDGQHGLTAYILGKVNDWFSVCVIAPDVRRHSRSRLLAQCNTTPATSHAPTQARP